AHLVLVQTGPHVVLAYVTSLEQSPGYLEVQRAARRGGRVVQVVVGPQRIGDSVRSQLVLQGDRTAVQAQEPERQPPVLGRSAAQLGEELPHARHRGDGHSAIRLPAPPREVDQLLQETTLRVQGAMLL